MVQKTLAFRRSPLASPEQQLHILKHQAELIPFEEKLSHEGLYPLRPTGIEVFQVNIGKMCNQACHHCHVDAGPDRKEIMSRETMETCLEVLRELEVKVVDITGGAPELNPHFEWFVEQLRALDKSVMVRCNLTIIVANPRFRHLPDFYRRHQVEVVSSLPFYRADRTDRQRGEGVFVDSIEALKMLNAVGYGMENRELILNLVYNPAGAFLPANQKLLERDFKSELAKDYGIHFNQLFCITNMPISRYLDYLLNSGNFEHYMKRLVSAFNPVAAQNVMCRNTLSVGWDGSLYDCDFNQMLDMTVDCDAKHIRTFDADRLDARMIRVNQHCYGCTAGSGSSCSGFTV